MDSEKVEKVENTEYIQYKYRWVIISLYAISSISGSIVSGAVAPVATKISETYNVSPATINVISMIYLLAYATMNFPATYFIDGKGLRVGILIGNGFFLIGIGICLLVNVSFYFVILAAIFNSFGNPFIMNTPTKIATYWFKNQNRTVATSILTAMNIVGSGIGFVLPTLIIDQDETVQQTKRQIFGMYILQGVLVGSTFVLNLVFLKAQPPTPASLGSQTEKTPFKESLKALIGNIQFIKLLCGFIFFYGVLNTFASVCNFIFRPFGYSDIQIAVFGVGLIFSGVTGSILTSIYVKRTLYYKKVLVAICSLSVTFMVLQSGVLMFIDSTAITFIGICCVGFFATPVLPITYDLGCQITFPVGQAQITGILNSCGMIFSFFMILGTQFAIGYGTVNQSTAMLIFLIVIMGLGLAFYSIIRPTLKRRQAEGGIKQSLGEQNSMPQQRPVDFKQIQLSNLQSPSQPPKNQYIDFTQQR